MNKFIKSFISVLINIKEILNNIIKDWFLVFVVFGLEIGLEIFGDPWRYLKEDEIKFSFTLHIYKNNKRLSNEKLTICSYSKDGWNVC